MTTLADLKKRRSTDFSKLTKALEETNSYGDNQDDQFWKLERDKAGNGSATIRFLPAYAGEDATEADELPWVIVYSHSFQGPTGKWYIENCLSTLKKEDPVNEMNRILWKGTDADKAQAKNQKRKTSYISQILVINDSKNPDNNGKVFFFKFGKKIFDKIMDAAKPTFEDDEPVNVFDLWEGANFKLRVKTVDTYPNYDNSVFDKPSAIADDDNEILEIVNQQKSLHQFVDGTNTTKFKTYEELEKKLKTVLSNESGSTKRAEEIAQEMREEARKAQTTPEQEVETVSVGREETSIADDDIDEDFFKMD